VPTEPESAKPEPAPQHDPTGLDLARSIAKAIGATPKRWSARSASPLARRRRRGVDPTVSGSHPDDRDPQPLDAAMDRLVAEHGWTTDVAVHGVFARWDRIVGRDVAQHCRPEAYADGRLVVRADSTAWATQVRLLAPTVVRRLNEELGDGTVLVVQVAGPRGPSWTKGRRSVRDGRGPRDTYG
jgi:predicted nucleic acid-binding Zn ribbon protein